MYLLNMCVGNMFTHVQAICAYLYTYAHMTINVTAHSEQIPHSTLTCEIRYENEDNYFFAHTVVNLSQ